RHATRGPDPARARPQALGARDHLGAHRPLRWQDPPRARGRGVEPPVPPPEGGDDARPLRSRDPGGRRRARRAPPPPARTAEGFLPPPGTRHRVTALEDADILEVSTPELDDVVQLEDRYGRVP